MQIHNRTAGIASEAVQSRLQRTGFRDAPSATKRLNNHLLTIQVISAKNGRVQVTKEDGSIIFAALQDRNRERNLAGGNAEWQRVRPEALSSQKYVQGNSQAFVGVNCNVLI